MTKTPKKDVSIEYAHIYTNNKIGEEQKFSLEILDRLTKKEKELGDDVSIMVMVDDYSFPDPSFDYDIFTQWLAGEGFKPDFVLRESQLIPVCDDVYHLIEDEKLKDQIGDYIRAKKYPCSLFIAAWYLLRLGYIESAIFDQDLIAKKLINILPQSFKPFEEKGLEIIRSTKHAQAADQVQYEFFEGRLIA